MRACIQSAALSTLSVVLIMMTFTELVSTEAEAQHSVALTYHQRVKGRLRITTDEGIVAGIVTKRGEELQHGMKLADAGGAVLQISAKAEAVSVAVADSQQLFARACYHVGNRHAEVQIEASQLVYLQDHVMDEMLRQLGLSVAEKMLPFSPENGAYSQGHTHSHDSHDHHHEH